MVDSLKRRVHVAALCWGSASAGDRGALMDGVASIRGDCSGRDRAGGTATEETATGRGAAQSTSAPRTSPVPSVSCSPSLPDTLGMFGHEPGPLEHARLAVAETAQT